MGPKLEILSQVEVMYQCDSTLGNAVREFNIKGRIHLAKEGKVCQWKRQYSSNEGQ
jgi:hypothetical protein